MFRIKDAFSRLIAALALVSFVLGVALVTPTIQADEPLTGNYCPGDCKYDPGSRDCIAADDANACPSEDCYCDLDTLTQECECTRF